MNIGGLLALHARKTTGKEALVYGDKRYSYQELNEQANRLAHSLLALGIKKGDKVALMMQNSDLFVISYFGILKAGAVAVPVNFRLAPPEALYIFNQSDSKVLIFDPEYEPIVQEAQNGSLPLSYIEAGDSPKLQGVAGWSENLQPHPAHDPQVVVEEWDDCEILYTSGTTGRPKGALLDHHRVLHVGLNILVHMGVNSRDRILHVAPLFHSAELNLFLVSGTYVGATHVVERVFVPQKILKTMEDEKITLFFGVPTMYNFFFQVPDFKKYDLSSVTRFGYGAAPMAHELVKKCIDNFGPQFFNLCGLTEGGPGGILLEPEDQLKKPGAGGKAINNLEARVVDKNDNDVKPGEVGEFIIRGETIMKCYYKNPQATEETIKDGWLYTGDLATIDEDGYMSLVDRKKDMIISGGENIYSTEVEQVLYAYPGVLEAAVIGMPNPVWGETVAAILCPKPGQELDVEGLKEFCRARLADYKVPRIFKIMELLPRNASGKVLKTVLRDKYKEA